MQVNYNNPVPYHVGGVIRNSGGGWAFIDDATHTPYGFSGVIDTLSDRLRCYLSRTLSRTHAVVATVDETYASNGYVVGLSVSTSYVDVMFYGGLATGYFTESGGTISSASDLWRNGITSIVNQTATKFRINHRYMGRAVPTVYCRNKVGGVPLHAVVTSSGEEYTDIEFYNPSGVATWPTGGQIYFHKVGGRTDALDPSQISGALANVWINGHYLV